jgi:hypothetical protein
METLFWGSSTLDLKITIFFLVVSFVISLIVWFFSKKFYVALLVFSVLANISFLVNIGSEMFVAYHFLWFGYFSAFAWPIINIGLIVYYASARPKKR